MAKQHTFLVGSCSKFQRAILLFAFLFFAVACEAQNLAATEYQKNLHRAITALDTLSQMDENETPEDYRHRLTETVAAVRNVIPEKQSIEQDGSVCSVDNAWLHKRLRDLETASQAERETIRLQLIESLRAIEQAEEFDKARSTNSCRKLRPDKN